MTTASDILETEAPAGDPIRDAFCILVAEDLVRQGWDENRAWQAAVFGWCNRQVFLEVMQ